MVYFLDFQVQEQFQGLSSTFGCVICNLNPATELIGLVATCPCFKQLDFQKETKRFLGYSPISWGIRV